MKRSVVLCAIVLAGVVLILAPLQYDATMRYSAINYFRETGTLPPEHMGFVDRRYLWVCLSVGIGLLLTAVLSLRTRTSQMLGE